MIGSLIGGVFGKMGGDAAAAGADKAAQAARDATVVARSDLSPWRSAGQSAIDEAMQLLGLGHLAPDYATNQAVTDATNRTADQAAAMARFQTDPGYQFRKDEGQKAINHSLAARGGALSGAGVKAGQRFADNLASQEYANYFSRITGLAGAGGSAAATGANAITSNAGTEANADVAAGKARQSGYNALGSGLGKGVSNLINWFT